MGPWPGSYPERGNLTAGMVDRARLAGVVVPAAGLAVTVALAVAAWLASRSHRAAAERVLRDYAGVAGSEFVRRTAFDVGFNGYQVIAAGLRRAGGALPPG